MKVKVIKHLTSWRTHRLLVLLIYLLSLVLASFKLLVLGFIVTVVAVAYEYATNGRYLGKIQLKYLFFYLLLVPVWGFALTFQGPKSTHRMHARHFEKRRVIKNIIGVDLPRYKVIESNLTYFNSWRHKYSVEATLEFRKPLDDKFYEKLDSISLLPMPEEPPKKSSYFYYGLEGMSRCWTKSGDTYRYSRFHDYKNVKLNVNSDFSFTIRKGDNHAIIRYGGT